MSRQSTSELIGRIIYIPNEVGGKRVRLAVIRARRYEKPLERDVCDFKDQMTGPGKEGMEGGKKKAVEKRRWDGMTKRKAQPGT